MKVLQIIDSLEVGGAERIAVTYANVLSPKLESHLCATRHEGLLYKTIEKSVPFLFLNKKHTLDFYSLLRLYSYVKRNNIKILHAHSSSFFLATLVKILKRDVKLVWHDHYGDSEHLEKRNFSMLKICSRFFDTIIVVNTKLEKWAKNNLHCNIVVYIPNFVTDRIENELITTLSGIEGKKILCIANFRKQKDHINLLNAFLKLNKKYPDYSLHLVGKNFNDEYESSIRLFIENNELKDKVFIYGPCTDVINILSQADIGVLSSKSEGLPVALLEYGLASLPVIVTDVGECSRVIKNNKNGLLVHSKNDDALYRAFLDLIENNTKRNNMAIELNKTIKANYSEFGVLEQIIKVYKNILG